MFDTKQEAERFMLSGNATITVANTASGNHFTYRIKKGKDDAPHFVQLLSGPDNDADYQFMGTIFNEMSYVHGRKSRIGSSAKSALAFAWTWGVIRSDTLQLPKHIILMHEGRCGRCARKLTDPVSISTGFGPHCRGELGIGDA